MGTMTGAEQMELSIFNCKTSDYIENQMKQNWSWAYAYIPVKITLSASVANSPSIGKKGTNIPEASCSLKSQRGVLLGGGVLCLKYVSYNILIQTAILEKSVRQDIPLSYYMDCTQVTLRIIDIVPPSLFRYTM